MEPNSTCGPLMISRSALGISVVGKSTRGHLSDLISFCPKASVQSCSAIMCADNLEACKKKQSGYMILPVGKGSMASNMKIQGLQYTVFILRVKNIETICHDWQKWADLLPVSTELPVRGANLWRSSSDCIETKVELSLQASKSQDCRCQSDPNTRKGLMTALTAIF